MGIEQETVLSAERFSAELKRHGVTTLFVTTALFNELVHERPDIFCTVRNVLFGGEECDPATVRKVFESGGSPERLVHVYGPTETTTFATWYEVKAGQSWLGRIPIGRPITNTTLYILDPHFNPVPVGITGEIWIGGEGVANGYLNRPELTAQRFIASPFASGQRLYRTGDLGRFFADGNVEFLGRLDNQIKIRGFRVELGEIESVLRQHPSVATAVLVARTDSSGSKHLVAYVTVSRSERTPSVQELREFLRQKLPDFMMPTAVMLLERLPLTANGKIDQNALPQPALDREGLSFVAPRNETEQTIAEVWSAVLEVQSIGAHDDFFRLGGHSLLAMRVVSRLRSIFAMDIPVRVILEHGTVAAMADYINGIKLTRVGTPLVPALSHEEIVI